jgi:hypothetical protein
MADIDALELSHATPPPSEPGVEGPPGRVKRIALGILLFAIGGSLGYWIYQRSRPVTVPAVAATAEPTPVVAPAPTAPRLEGENIFLPPLAETDSIVRTLVGTLSAQPKILTWLATNRLIENFTVVTLSIAEGRSPAKLLRPLVPQGKFRVRTGGGHTLIDRASYQRYDDYGAAIGALDATGTARLYLTLKPRIVDAYRQLGYPDADFDPALERAMGVLLAVPVIETDIAVREKIVTYEFADPATESLSSAARQFLRMGPANVRIVQAKLREVAQLLGLHPGGSTGA